MPLRDPNRPSRRKNKRKRTPRERRWAKRRKFLATLAVENPAAFAVEERGVLDWAKEQARRRIWVLKRPPAWELVDYVRYLFGDDTADLLAAEITSMYESAIREFQDIPK